MQRGKRGSSVRVGRMFCFLLSIFFLTGLISLFSPVFTHNSVMSFGAVPVSV